MAGPTLKLEVFRCPQRGKGWGVRCRSDVASGTYIADYLGELIPEQGADARGLNYSDEYLFNLGDHGSHTIYKCTMPYCPVNSSVLH
jgi:SET domain-containing protein